MSDFTPIPFKDFIKDHPTFPTLSQRKRAYIKTAYALDNYSVIVCEKTSGIGFKSYYEWNNDQDFHNILDAILEYKRELRIAAENDLKAKIKKDSLKVLHECIKNIKKGKIKKEQTPILIFANKALNDMVETQKHLNNHSGDLGVNVTVEKITGMEIS